MNYWFTCMFPKASHTAYDDEQQNLSCQCIPIVPRLRLASVLFFVTVTSYLTGALVLAWLLLVLEWMICLKKLCVGQTLCCDLVVH